MYRGTGRQAGSAQACSGDQHCAADVDFMSISVPIISVIDSSRF